MKLVSFEQATKDMNEQLEGEPVKSPVSSSEMEFLTKMAIDIFKVRCGDVPSFYVDAGPHGMIEIVLGEPGL
jgi:hypothetical protein